MIYTIKELNWVQGQEEIRETHCRWNVQEKVSLTFKVTFKHLRLEAWGANSAKARGRAFQREREEQAPRSPGGGVQSKGQQAWSKVGRRQEPGPAGVLVRHAQGILRQWEEFEEFLKQENSMIYVSKVLFGHSVKRGLNRIKVQGYAKI